MFSQSLGINKKRVMPLVDDLSTPVLRRQSSRLRRRSISKIIKKQSKTNLKNGHECSKSTVRSRQRSQSSKSLPSQMRKKRKFNFPRCTSKTLSMFDWIRVSSNISIEIFRLTTPLQHSRETKSLVNGAHQNDQWIVKLCLSYFVSESVMSHASFRDISQYKSKPLATT